MSIPFTLVCFECDAGMEIRTRKQAEKEGWVGIILARDLPMANYLGTCPNCHRAEINDNLRRPLATDILEYAEKHRREQTEKGN